MIILVINKFFGKRFLGITLWPFILIKNQALKGDKILINHEKIHLRQQIEMLVIPFYLWYVIEYLFRLLQYKDRHLAYKNISFEREAYTHEKNIEYLKTRRFFMFISYLRMDT